MRLQLGRRLLAALPAEEVQASPFEVVDNLNSGASLVTSPEERLTAAGLNLAVADDRWAATLLTATQMHALARTLRLLFGKRAKGLEAALEETRVLLRAAQMPPNLTEPHIDLEWDPVSAFQEGRHFERRRQITSARRHFLDEWPALQQRIRAARRKGKKK